MWRPRPLLLLPIVTEVAAAASVPSSVTSILASCMALVTYKGWSDILEKSAFSENMAEAPKYRLRHHFVQFLFELRSHRVDRVLYFFSSRLNWDPPHPLTRMRVSPPLVRGGGTPPFRDRRWRSQFGRGDRHCGTLGITCTLCAELHVTEVYCSTDSLYLR
jgi:hypothetical protein